MESKQQNSPPDLLGAPGSLWHAGHLPLQDLLVAGFCHPELLTLKELSFASCDFLMSRAEPGHTALPGKKPGPDVELLPILFTKE